MSGYSHTIPDYGVQWLCNSLSLGWHCSRCLSALSVHHGCMGELGRVRWGDELADCLLALYLDAALLLAALVLLRLLPQGITGRIFKKSL